MWDIEARITFDDDDTNTENHLQEEEEHKAVASRQCTTLPSPLPPGLSLLSSPASTDLGCKAQQEGPGPPP